MRAERHIHGVSAIDPIPGRVIPIRPGIAIGSPSTAEVPISIESRREGSKLPKGSQRLFEKVKAIISKAKPVKTNGMGAAFWSIIKRSLEKQQKCICGTHALGAKCPFAPVYDEKKNLRNLQKRGKRGVGVLAEAA